MAGTNYTRQSTFDDGDVITAGLFNNEFNQLLNAFAYTATGTTGHQHDGSAGQGGNIGIIGDQDFFNKIAVDTTNNRWGFYVQVGGAAVEQIRIQDGAIVPVTDNDIDLGTSSLQFKDAYINGTLEADAITVAGITLSETIADTVGAMATSNTETGITVTYNDADNTLDFVIGAGDIVSSMLETNVTVAGNIIVGGTVDGRDVATDGTKLDGIEASATADQTDAEIRAAVEAASDSNVFTDADHTKLNSIETGADVVSTASVTAVGALMDSELTALASVKAINQGLATTDSPTFVDLTVSGDDITMGTNTADALLIADGTNFSPTTIGSLTELTSIAGDDVFLAIDTSGGGLKKVARSTVVQGLAASNAIANVVEDTTPQLGGDLDSQGKDITDVGILSADTVGGIYGSSSSPVVFTVTVASKTSAHPYNGDGSSSAYFLNGVESPAIQFSGVDGITSSTGYYYKFDLADSSNSGHPLRFYYDAAKTTAYTTGVTTSGTAGSSGAHTTIAVTADTPNILYYECSSHSYMGNYATAVTTTIGTTGAVKIPSGTTAQRPTAVAGQLRYNSTTGEFEGYTDSWGNVGSGQVVATANNSTDETVYVTFVDGQTGDQGIETDSGLTYNPSSGLITTDSASFSGTGGIKVPVGTTAQRPTNAAGQFRYNSTEGKFEGYTTEWGEIGGGAIDLLVNTFTGNGSTTAYTLSSSPLIANTLVYIDGVYQNKSAYSIANDVITFSAAPASGAVIEATAASIGEVSTTSTSFAITQLTGNGSTTAFTLSTQTAENNTNVYFDGVYQSKANYSVSGNTLTFSTAPANGVSIEVMASEGITLTIGTPDNGTVTTAKITDDAVTQAKIADDAVGADQLATSAVVTASIVDANVTTAKIADSNVTQAKIADDAVGADQLASSAVVTASIVDDAVTAAKIASEPVAVGITTVVTSASMTATVNTHVFVDTATRTITLPASPTIGQRVLVTVGNFEDTVIGRNSSNIMSSGTDMTLDKAYLSIQFIYTNSTVGWAIA